MASSRGSTILIKPVRWMTVCIAFCNSTIGFTSFVKGTIRYNRILPFVFIRHRYGKLCKRDVGQGRWVSEEPGCVTFARMRLRGWPTMMMFLRKSHGKCAKPDIVCFGCADPGRTGMMEMNRTVPAIFRILELKGRGAERRWQGQFLLGLADRHGAAQAEQEGEGRCPVRCIEHLD